MSNNNFVGFYAYLTRSGDALDYYEILKIIFEKFNTPIKHYWYTYTLPSDKADHPGDFDSKKITRNKLEEGLKSKEIISFSIANSIYPNNNSDCMVSEVTDNAHGGSSISLIMPDSENYQEIHDKIAKSCIPEYAFSTKLPTAYYAILYTVNTAHRKNEKNNFYPGKSSGDIKKPRMVYEENYLSSLQLIPELLQAIEKLSGANALVKICDDLFKWSVNPQDLDEFNRLLGEQGLLISWHNPVRNKRKSG